MNDNSDQKIIDKIRQFADLENKKVLEVGCGDGRITSLLYGKPQKIVAIDPDTRKIRDAGNNLSGVDFRIGSGENLDFPDAYFDLVIFTLSLHHQDSSAAIREAARVLHHSGEILIIEPVVEGEVEKAFALVHNENQAKLDAQKSIQNSGLKVERTETFTANWFFDNKEELCQSIFKYYDVPFNPSTTDEIIDLLGVKSETQPLELSDLMVIQSLKKD